MSKPTFLVLLCTHDENLPEVYKTSAEMTQEQIDALSMTTPGDRLFGVDIVTCDLDPTVWKPQTPANSKEILIMCLIKNEFRTKFDLGQNI